MTLVTDLLSNISVHRLDAISAAKATIAVLASYWVVAIVYRLFFHPLRNIPGPFLARTSQVWRNVRYFRGTWHDDILQVHEQFGPVVRIAPNEISFVDEEGLRTLYGYGKSIKKTKWYDTWKVPGMTISFFAATDLATHRHLRSRVQGAYTTTSLLTMEPLLQEVLDANWSRFECFARSGEVIALDKWANYLTFDIVGQLAMGGTIGFIQQGLDVNGIIRSIHDGFWLMANMGNIPLQMFWFNNPIIKRLVRVLGIKRLNAFDDFVEWLDIRVEQRMNNKDGMPRWDMLQHFIEAKDMDKNPVKKADVMIEGVNILGAGADTTAIGILACVGALLKHPEYIPRLRDEIDHAYQQLGLDSSREHIKFTDAQNLPWLSAIIKESTRLHPSIQYQLPRYVPAGGVQIGPYFLPEGTVCGISCRSTNRSKKAFGADAGSFRPERWISQSKEDDERIKYCNSMLTTFGTGSRSCVGKNLATIEMYKYVAQFFRTFDAELLDMSEPWKTRSQWFSFQRDFKVRLRLRDTCVSGGGVEK